MFLLTLAILDDLGAIIIIALFYTDNLSLSSLAVAGGALAVLAILNARHVTSIPAYVLVGLVLWVAVLKSGVHATLAGVALALFIPIRAREDGGKSPLRSLEHDLHPVVAYAILPLFAFANAGGAQAGRRSSALSMTLRDRLHSMSLFITNLAFGDDAPRQAVSAVFGVLVGSVCAALFGYLLLRFTTAPRAQT